MTSSDNLYRQTVDSRPVALGTRIEVTTHLPHRPWRIEAYLVRPGSDQAEIIATMDLARGRPTWVRKSGAVTVPAADLLALPAT